MIVINNDKDSLREKALPDHDNDRIREVLGEVEE